jgi:hypothetical protein
MGATTFETTARGKTALDAFQAAVRDAQWESGHGGYTGTIAEKHDFVLITPPKDRDPLAYAREIMDSEPANPAFRRDAERVCDKWGPAGCIHLIGDKFLFFGWASC